MCMRTADEQQGRSVAKKGGDMRQTDSRAGLDEQLGTGHHVTVQTRKYFFFEQQQKDGHQREDSAQPPKGTTPTSSHSMVTSYSRQMGMSPQANTAWSPLSANR